MTPKSVGIKIINNQKKRELPVFLISMNFCPYLHKKTSAAAAATRLARNKNVGNNSSQVVMYRGGRSDNSGIIGRGAQQQTGQRGVRG